MGFQPFKNIGPGALVTAAFIGPGTITVCTQAGVNFGFALLWALVLSIIATIVLQEMSARLGLVYGKGLAEAVREVLTQKWLRYGAILLILSAILIGNSAYQAGNISGGVVGLQLFIPNSQIQIGDFSFNYLTLVTGAIAFVVLYIGNYKVLERVLVALVILMSLAFIITAILTKPDLGEMLSGMFIPKSTEGSLFTIIGLIGTTVVPYNLFLHSSLVREKWSGTGDLKHSKWDTIVSIGFGGLVSMAIVVCAAAVQSQEIKSGADLAKGLEPLFGSWANYFLGIGMFAAGITSAITAPMAAAYVARGCFGWKGDLKSRSFRAVWMSILAIGVIVSMSGIKPIEIIQFAQIANGILLPIIAIFLLWVVNRAGIMREYVNTTFQNILAGGIILITLVLAVQTFIKVLGSV